MNHIISASRRTDIPQFYTNWFHNRLKEGYAEYRTVYGGGKNGYFRVSLRKEDVIGYLFWTKYAGPFHKELHCLRQEGIPYVFQYTITGYGGDVQPGIPSTDRAIDDFISLAGNFPSAKAIQWRYDPILISVIYNADWHRRNFESIARKLSGYTQVVNISFIEPYLKVIAKAPTGHEIKWRISDGRRHHSALRKYPDLLSVGEDETALLQDLEQTGRRYGISLHICCNTEYATKFPLAQCCSSDMFAPYGKEIYQRVLSLRPGPSRDHCQCIKTVDIGMDTTCPGGCFYCYVTASRKRALMNYERHDPALARLR